jgi:hypothetical protein
MRQYLDPSVPGVNSTGLNKQVLKSVLQDWVVKRGRSADPRRRTARETTDDDDDDGSKQSGVASLTTENPILNLESSMLMRRFVDSVDDLPSRLQTAVACDCLVKIAATMPQFESTLKVVIHSILCSIYPGYFAKMIAAAENPSAAADIDGSGRRVEYHPRAAHLLKDRGRGSIANTDEGATKRVYGEGFNRLRYVSLPLGAQAESSGRSGIDFSALVPYFEDNQEISRRQRKMQKLEAQRALVESSPLEHLKYLFTQLVEHRGRDEASGGAAGGGTVGRIQQHKQRDPSHSAHTILLEMIMLAGPEEFSRAVTAAMEKQIEAAEGGGGGGRSSRREGREKER